LEPHITSGATAAVMSWIESDERRAEHWRARARQALNGTEHAFAIGRLAAALCDEVSDAFPPMDGLASDLLPHLLVRVNYFEIAHALLDEVSSGQQQQTHAA
jgi:hypothetical protein